MFKHRKHSDTAADVTFEPVDASLTDDDAAPRYQPRDPFAELRDAVAAALGGTADDYRPRD